MIIAACNPVRATIQHSNGREKDLGKEWVGGHYQVTALPRSLDLLKWSFGSLSTAQEEEFIFRRIEMIGKGKLPGDLCESMTRIVVRAHETIREFAARNVFQMQVRENNDYNASLEDTRARASSVVSLRDIQRVFSLFDFFCNDFVIDAEYFNSSCKNSLQRCFMLLSVAVVYFLRLDSQSRIAFLEMMKKINGDQGAMVRMDEVLDAAVDWVVKNMTLGKGIALTRGLKENIFATLICSLSRTPLMIVGPPGCSKVGQQKGFSIDTIFLLGKILTRFPLATDSVGKCSWGQRAWGR